MPKYPGILTTADGSDMVAYVETHIGEIASCYPITPSTVMPQRFQEAVANGLLNLWGQPIELIELESEHSAASTCEGAAMGGSRVVNFTSAQGLVLMKEVLYPIAGKKLPMVFHIGARALTFHSLNIHCGHDDVMAVADCGWAMLFARNVQEVGDLALIARRASEEVEVPFMVVQDGFLTTHTVETCRLPESELMKDFVGDPREKIRIIMDPYHPIMTGPVQNQDSYMKGKVAQRDLYAPLAGIIQKTMMLYKDLTGRAYDFVRPYQLEDAQLAIVAMGTMQETAEMVVDHLRKTRGWKVGALAVTCFRPFPSEQIVDNLKNVEAFSVIERMDNPLAQSNPLTCEIKAAFADALVNNKISRIPTIYSGQAGLGSRDVKPMDLAAVFENMHSKGLPRSDDRGKRYFALNVEHPLTLKPSKQEQILPRGCFSLRGHSVGGLGSITTNKVMATLIGTLYPDLFVQAYPRYGSEKKSMPTAYYLSVAKEHIRFHNELEYVEFVACNDPNSFRTSNPLSGLKDKGIIFMHSDKMTAEEIWQQIPESAQDEIRNRAIKVYAIDTVRVARDVSSEPDLIVRMQGIVFSGAFLKIATFVREAKLSDEQIFKAVEQALRKYFGRRGEQVIQDNMTCIRRGYTELIEVTPARKTVKV